DTTKQSYKSDPTNSSIMGSQIIDRAYNYMQLSWIASQYNIAEPQGTNVQTIIQIPPGSGNYYSVETIPGVSNSISYSKLERGECIELFWKSCQDIFK
ncbi:MAG: hypothetical protein B6D61_04995, partial [Bacteroidetes bacterium 4484_249]